MKVARSSAIAGAGGTSNVAAAMRYGLRPVGTMAHSYVMSFEREEDAFRAFLEDFSHSTVLLVDTYDSAQGVRTRSPPRATPGSRGVRLDSGDLLELSREARRLLDEADADAVIVASGDLQEHRIAELVAAGAPIDRGWGPSSGPAATLRWSTASTSSSPTAPTGVAGVEALRQGDPPGAEAGVPRLRRAHGRRRRRDRGRGRGAGGEPLLVEAMRGGEIVREETLDEIRARTTSQLDALPEALRPPRTTSARTR